MAFHLIDSPTHTVYIPEGDGGGLVKRMRAGERSGGRFGRLGRYRLSVYENLIREMEQAGGLELLEDGTAILITSSLYGDHTWLSLETDLETGLFTSYN